MSSQYTFVKVFSTITDSSIWCEDSDTRVIWVTMLAMADQYGCIHAAITGLAKRAAVPVEKTEEALSKFLSPDPYSRDEEHEGRRIEVIKGGWRLLNYGKYRAKIDADARRKYKARKQKEYREKKRGQESGQNVDKC